MLETAAAFSYRSVKTASCLFLKYAQPEYWVAANQDTGSKQSGKVEAWLADWRLSKWSYDKESSPDPTLEMIDLLE